MRVTWRMRVAPIIAAVLAETAGQDRRTVQKALWKAWDDALLGPKEMHPYKIWLSEVARQQGRTKPKPAREAEEPGNSLRLPLEEEP